MESERKAGRGGQQEEEEGVRARERRRWLCVARQQQR